LASIVIQRFDDAEIRVTARSRQARVNGESFIVDWNEAEFSDSKRAFEQITANLHHLLGSGFVPQRNHHSAIVSKRLDPIDRAAGSVPPEWLDPEFAASRRIFREQLGFALDLQLCVVAYGGTIQLVYGNETRLPGIRRRLVDLGAEVKPGTIEGDRFHTCTVVLGYMLSAPEREPETGDIVEAIVPAPETIAVTRASLVRYRDTAFNDYETLVNFSGQASQRAAFDA
jgi:hypothetical protein